MTDTLNIEHELAPVPGGRLYYEVAGAGHPLLLIHAGIADHRMWDDQFAAFASHYRVIRYDMRGFGATTTADIPFSDRQDIADLLRYLGIQRTYIMGVSMGGQVAIDFTIEHPEMVAGLIPVCAGLSGYDPPAGDPREQALFAELQAAEERAEIARVAELDVRVWVDGPLQPAGRADQRVRQRVYDMSLNNYTIHEFSGEREPLDPPAVDRLGEIRVPTLVIVGDLDASETLLTAERLVQGIAGARKAVIEGTAHLPNMEQPARFNQVVLEFLAGI